MLLGVVPLALIAVVDLATGALTGDRRVDIGLLAAAALAGTSVISQRRLARRLRANDFPRRATTAQWVRAAASILVGLAFSAGVGYLIGGWIVAILLPAVTVLLTGFGVVRGLRKRRRLREERALLQ